MKKILMFLMYPFILNPFFFLCIILIPLSLFYIDKQYIYITFNIRYNTKLKTIMLYIICSIYNTYYFNSDLSFIKSVNYMINKYGIGISSNIENEKIKNDEILKEHLQYNKKRKENIKKFINDIIDDLDDTTVV